MDFNKLVNLQQAVVNYDGANNQGSSQGNPDPVNVSDNMKDLSAFEYNSADEVRQAMKSVMSGNIPANFNEESSGMRHKSAPTGSGDKDYAKTANVPMGSKKKGGKIRIKYKLSHGSRDIKTATVRQAAKRRAPPKKNTKKTRQAEIDAMYVGKLSNLVTFKNRRILKIVYDTESDMSSMYSSS